jgi:hypothetical protein
MLPSCVDPNVQKALDALFFKGQGFKKLAGAMFFT